MTRPAPLVAPPPIPRFIGIRGDKGHGKNAIAEILGSFGYRTAAFADPLKRAVMDVYDLSFAQVYGTIEQKETIDPRLGKTPREVMQHFGTEVGRHVHGDTWVLALREQIRRLEEDNEIPVYENGTRGIRGWRWTTAAAGDRPRLGWAICDTRFPNEIDAIHAWGGEVWRVVRPNYGTGAFESHASERALDGLPADREIVNGGSLDDLRRAAALALMQAAGNRVHTHWIDADGQDVPEGTPDARPMPLVYGWDGGLVADLRDAVNIVSHSGVLQPELPDPACPENEDGTPRAACVGKAVFGKHAGAWFGWSHRAAAAFRVGDMRFDRALLDRSKPAYAKWSKVPYHKVGTELITTDAEARAAAVDFAAYIDR